MTRPVIVLTGGPCGGKSTLIAELGENRALAGRFVALPEAIHYASGVGISPRERLFQRVMVQLQVALEEAIDRALGADPRPLICHRGTLDPLAFWLQRGWPEGEFFEFAGLSRQDHYRRYAAVLHLVTAADGAAEAYTRWPEAHRPETAREAVSLDRWLEKAWRGHPGYFRLDNNGQGWPAKSREASEILARILGW